MAKVLSVFLDDRRKTDFGTKNKEKSMTQQSSMAECDINSIIKKFEMTGLATHVSEKVAQYGDFTQVGDFQSAMYTVTAANDMFMALPAHVRERFKNDPAVLLDFLSDPQNEAEGLKLGLLEAKKPPEVVPPTPEAKTPPESK